MNRWRFAMASVRGTSHVKSGQPCQDSSLCELVNGYNNEEFLVLVASDGAGSAALSHQGSTMVCQFFVNKLSRYIQQGWLSLGVNGTIDDEAAAYRLVRIISKKIEKLAKKEGASKRDFAATLLLAIIAPKYSIFLQIGDGAIVVNSGSGYYPVFWPQSGEYANMTHFITDESVLKNIQFKTSNEPMYEIALFTDGIQSLALKYDSQSAHAPFFRPLFDDLRQARQENLLLLNSRLSLFLESDAVNERTNDDKTLIIACQNEDESHIEDVN